MLLIILPIQALAYTKLEKGASGDEVWAMQSALQSLGYSITVDGKYGPATVSVVKSFQRQHGLEADGVAGNKTLTLLYTLVSGASNNPAIATAAPTASTLSPQSAGGTVATVFTGGASLNLRQYASSGAKVITTIPNGEKVIVHDRDAAWASVVYEGIAGYVMVNYLSFDNNTVKTPEPAATPTPGANAYQALVVTTGGSLNLRQYARSGAKVLLTIPNRTAITVSAKGDAWCAVTYQGVVGYVMTSFLRFPSDPAETPIPAATAASSPAPVSPGVSVGTAVVTTSGGSVNLRSQASTGAKVLLSVPNAAIVTVQAKGTEWSAVTYNGTFGYIMSKYITIMNAVPSDSGDDEEEDPSVYRRTLKKGMTGEDVAWVQHRLDELGYALQITNIYDDATFSAVKSFQSQNGLDADGLAGAQTFSVLKSENARRADAQPLTYATLRIDQSGDGVRKLQTDLKAMGYPVSVNGTFDTDTHNAVVAFQQRNGLVISGIADALTRQVIHGGQGKPYSTPVEALPANEGWMAAPAITQVKLLHWQNEIKPYVKTGQTFTVLDPNTNLSWKLVFYSLGRHADSQPASWRDTQIMNRSFGSTSWTIHPVYVLLPSGQWTLATMHNRPHLYGSITNNGFGGHLCVHFLRDMAEAQKNDPKYGVNNQVTLRNAWKALTGETVD